MKSVVIALVFIMFTVSVNAEVEIKHPAIEIATTYFTTLSAGDLETADSLISAPFIFLKTSNVLMSIEEVKSEHRKIVRHNGKRDVPRYEVSINTEHELHLNKEIFKGDYEIVSFLLLDGENSGDYLYFHIEKIDDIYSVVGISEDKKYQ